MHELPSGNSRPVVLAVIVLTTSSCSSSRESEAGAYARLQEPFLAQAALEVEAAQDAFGEPARYVEAGQEIEVVGDWFDNYTGQYDELETENCRADRSIWVTEITAGGVKG